jgi:hypothetical protein
MSHDHSHSFWGQFKSLASVLAEFQRTLPPPDDPWGLQPGEIVSPTNPYILHAHMCSQVCTILLYNIIIHQDANAYHKVLDAAYSMASLVRRIRGSRGSAPIQTPCSLIVSDKGPMVRDLSLMSNSRACTVAARSWYAKSCRFDQARCRNPILASTGPRMRWAVYWTCFPI